MKEEMKEEEARFTKQALMESRAYAARRDLLEAVLQEGQEYTRREAETEMKKYQRRSVK